MSLTDTKNPSQPSKGSSGAVSSEKQECPKIAYELVELVEVVTQTKEKWVKGGASGQDAKDASIFDGSVARGKKDGVFRQYINIEKDTEGTDKRHPEYGREIVFRARIKRKDNKTEKLDNVKVAFKNTCTKAANRANPDDKIWDKAELTGDQKEGFGSKNGDAEKIVTTDDKGWTSQVSFFLSQYGGDQFEISADLHPDVEGASSSQTIKTIKYQVWRKFWYQMTYHDELAAKKPTTAEGYFAEVFAEMMNANEKKFKKTDFTKAQFGNSEDDKNDFLKRTFLKEYMFEKGGSDNEVCNIGTGNIDQFSSNDKLNKKTDPDDSKECPLKMNLFVTKWQCDPEGPSTFADYELKENGEEIVIEKGTGGSIVCMPALEKGEKLVAKGEWGVYSGSPRVWTKKGDITDDCITIDSARDKTLKIKVDLTHATAISGSVPTPSDVAPVKIKLQVQTAGDYGGWAPAAGIVATFDGTDANFKTFNLTVAHELGHKFSQVPESTKQEKSLKDHPELYVGHGGSGAHCRHGASSCESASDTTSSRNAETTITVTLANSDTHKVADGEGFIDGHKVTVKDVEKTLKKVWANDLDFTDDPFDAERGDRVVQKLTYGDAVDWNEADEKWPEPIDGTCLMYHARNDVKEKFCDTCKPYLQLQDMSQFKG